MIGASTAGSRRCRLRRRKGGIMNWSEELGAQVNEIWKRSLVRILVKLVAEMVDVEGQ